MINKLTIFILTIYLVSSCGQKEVLTQMTEQQLNDLKRRIENTGLQIALAHMDSIEPGEFETYKMKLKRVIDLMPTTWTMDSSKLTIDSYIKKGNFGDSYLTYSYKMGQLQTSTEVPQHVKDSFDKNFVCYSGEYWKKLKIEQSIGFMWDTLGTKMMVQIVNTK
jgi:hypothetical protein